MLKNNGNNGLGGAWVLLGRGETKIKAEGGSCDLHMGVGGAEATRGHISGPKKITRLREKTNRAQRMRDGPESRAWHVRAKG